MKAVAFVILLCVVDVAALSRDFEKKKKHKKPRPNTVLLATHHKTGTSLCTLASRCFQDKANVSFDQHFTGDLLRDTKHLAHHKFVHFVRNPFSLVVSGYLYHRTVGEDFTLETGSAKVELKSHLWNRPWLRKLVNANVTQSYTTFLREHSETVGLNVEMLRMYYLFDEIRNASKVCDSHPRTCLSVCLENFTRSSEEYDAGWKQLLKFIEVTEGWKIKKCLQRFDLNRRVPEDPHVISATSDPKYIKHLLDVAKKVDVAKFRSRFQTYATGRMQCEAIQNEHEGFPIEAPNLDRLSLADSAFAKRWERLETWG